MRGSCGVAACRLRNIQTQHSATNMHNLLGPIKPSFNDLNRNQSMNAVRAARPLLTSLQDTNVQPTQQNSIANLAASFLWFLGTYPRAGVGAVDCFYRVLVLALRVICEAAKHLWFIPAGKWAQLVEYYRDRFKCWQQ